MPLPLAHGLIGASVVAALCKDLSLRKNWGRLALGAALGIIPDLDLFVSWAFGYSMKVHGGFTHSIVFSAALGSAVSLLLKEPTIRGVLGYIFAVMSHGILDSVVRKKFGGAQLLWPFSTERYKLGVFPDYEFYPNLASQPIAEILRDSLKFLGYELLIYLPIFLLIVLAAGARRNASKR